MKKLASLKASGLVEVLIVMAIIGTTLVSSMLLVSQGFIEVRNNQTEDEINGLIIQTINKIKNSNSYSIISSEFNSITTSTQRNFYISNNDNLVLDPSESPTRSIATCEPTSIYNVVAREIVQTSLNLDLCIQISIRRLQAGTVDRFTGSVNYAYTLSGETISSSLSFAKYNEFTVNTGGSSTGGITPSGTGGTSVR